MTRVFPRLAATLVLAALTSLACSEPDQPAEVLVSPPTLSFDALTATARLSATVKNEKGAELVGAAVSWSPSSSTVATVDGSGNVTAVGNGTADITASAGAISGTSKVTVAQLATKVEAASGGTQTGAVGQALPAALVAQIRDRLDNGIKDVAVTFTVSPDGGTVSPSSGTTGTNGQVSTTWTFGTKAGSHSVVASLPGTGASISFPATATPGPAFVLSKVGGDNQLGYRGSRLAQFLAVRVRDQYGNGIRNHVVAFTAATGNGVVDSAVAFTDTAGIARTGWVLPDAIDTVALSASAQGAGGTALAGSPQAFTAIAHGLRVTTVSPSPLVEGQPAVLTGNGFDPTPGNNTVKVGDLTASVTTASPTQLDITVPASDCGPARSAEVIVTAGGFSSTPVGATVNPPSFVSLAVGQQQIVRDPTQFCFQFPKTAAQEVYLIGVQSTSETVTDLTAISLSGTAVAPAAAPRPTAARQDRGTAVSPVDLARLQRWARHRAVEAAMRESDRLIWEASARVPQARAAAPRAGAAIVDSTVRVGDTVMVRITTGSGCANYVDATTVVRAKGQRGIFLHHITAPTGGFDTTRYRIFSQGFDSQYFPRDSAYFGAPRDTDANGHVVMVYTPEVNKRGALGLTTSCDNFPRTSNPASNEGEFFYVRVPDPGGSVGPAYTLADGIADMPPTLTHELVHVIQFGGRRAAGGPFPSTWLAEGQAVLGEEIMGHAVEGKMPGQNYGLRIAINLDDTSSTDWFSTGIVGLGLYYGWDPITNSANPDGRVATAPHECSWLAAKPANPGPCVGGLDPYGAPWALLRWLSDRFYPAAAAQPGFHQAIISSTQNGYAMVQSLIGVSMDTLLTQFAAMLYVDGLVASAASQLTMSSWNLFDIFYGTDSGIRLRTSLRLQPTALTYGTFARTAQVRAASTYYAIVSGFNREATAVKARDSGGGILPPWMRYWIVRIE